MMHAVGGRILFVDLGTGEVRKVDTTEEMIREYLGGDGLAVKLFTEAMSPEVEAFDPRNVLVFAPGLFTGTKCKRIISFSVRESFLENNSG